MSNLIKEHTIICPILLLMLSACKPLDTKKRNMIINELVFLCEGGDDRCNGISISYFKKHHTLINKRQIAEKEFQYDTLTETFIFTGNHNYIPLMTLVNFNYYEWGYELKEENSLIENGYIIKYEAGIYNDTAFIPLKSISYKKGSLSGEFKIVNTKDSVLYKTTFKKGTGYWKDYYYKQNRLREEGGVKNNCKIGLWTYYNLSGTVDSTKTYTLKDAVDLRFPFNLYNTKEPRSIVK